MTISAKSGLLRFLTYSVSLTLLGLLAITLSGAVSLFHNFKSPTVFIRPAISHPLSSLYSDQATLTFDSLERALAKIHDQGEFLIVNESLVPVFNWATDDFRAMDLSPAQIQHIQSVIRKTLPTSAGRTFAELFPNVVAYRRAEYLVTQNNAVPDSAAATLNYNEQLLQLQQHYLGEDLSHLVYGKDFLLLKYFLQQAKAKSNGGQADSTPKDFLKNQETE